MHPLLDRFEQNVAKFTDRPAACDQALSLDYQAFRAVACGLAGRIAEQTDRPRVGMLAPTSTACAVSVFAAWYANKTAVPLNFMLAPDEFGKVVADSGIDLVVAHERFAPAAQSAGLKLIQLGPDSLAPGHCETPQTTGDELAAVIYTSGTSGVPKGVCLSFDNITRNADACIEAAELSSDQVFLGLLPQFHAFGLTATTIVPLIMGATVHYHARFSPAAVVETIREQRVSVFITIASMFGALVARRGATAEDFASLTHPVSGGEPLSPKVAKVFEERFGRRILEGYGMTEASPVVSLNTSRAFRPGSVGRALPGITVEAVDVDGKPLPAGKEGQLVVHGHCVMQGYLNKPDQTAETIRDGALYTGDIGHVDGDGFIFITGRAKEMMIVGGENVFPFEIESVLVEHPGVAEAAVIGVQDDVRGEVPVAFVIGLEDGPALQENELRDFCRKRLAAYKVPREIHVESDLPRGPTGKILKRAIRRPT